MLDQIQSWLRAHELVLWVAVVSSAVIAIGSIVALPLVIVGLPRNYFTTRRRTPIPFGQRHPAVRWSLRILKSATGILLILFGIALLVLPGQGLLMVVAGLVLAEFPGKRRLELALVRRPRVMRAMNWVRRRAHKDPFDPPGRRPAQAR